MTDHRLRTPAAPRAAPRRVILTLQVGLDPIAGTVAVAGRAPTPFRGWLELVAALDAARLAPGSGAEPAARPGRDRPDAPRAKW